MRAAVLKALGTPLVLETVAPMAPPAPVAQDPIRALMADMEARVRNEIAQAAKLVKLAGLKPE